MFGLYISYDFLFKLYDHFEGFSCLLLQAAMEKQYEGIVKRRKAVKIQNTTFLRAVIQLGFPVAVKVPNIRPWARTTKYALRTSQTTNTTYKENTFPSSASFPSWGPDACDLGNLRLQMRLIFIYLYAMGDFILERGSVSPIRKKLSDFFSS